MKKKLAWVIALTLSVLTLASAMTINNQNAATRTNDCGYTKVYTSAEELFPDVNWTMSDTINDTYEAVSTRKSLGDVGTRLFDRTQDVKHNFFTVSTYEDFQASQTRLLVPYLKEVDLTENPFTGEVKDYNKEYNDDAPYRVWAYQEFINNGFIYQPGLVKCMKAEGFSDAVLDYTPVYQKWQELGITENDLYYGITDAYLIKMIDNRIENHQ